MYRGSFDCASCTNTNFDWRQSWPGWGWNEAVSRFALVDGAVQVWLVGVADQSRIR